MDFDFREYDAGDGSRKICPIPREITAGCGLSWKAVPEARDEILTALEKAGCHWEGEYILEL